MLLTPLSLPGAAVFYDELAVHSQCTDSALRQPHHPEVVFVDVVEAWTGAHATALQRALRETNEGFATARLGVAVRTVAKWNANPEMVISHEMQKLLDTLLFQSPDDVKARFAAFNSQMSGHSIPQPRQETQAADPLADIAQWVSSTNTSDTEIEELGWAVTSLAGAHPRTPAKQLLPEVLRVHKRVQAILKSGKQRLSQTRDLLRIDSQLLAHVCLLLGDVNQDALAEQAGAAALLLATEAEADQAQIWYARAKTARWQDKYIEAADYARRGYERSTDGPIRLQLAWYEANASALMGDINRAKQAVRRAELLAGQGTDSAAEQSAWSFPVERQALFAMSFSARTGDPDAALRAIAVADEAWASGERPEFPALWAQFRVGAAMALLLKDSLDGAAEQVMLMLDLPTELRMATVTRYLEGLEPALAHPRFRRSSIAVDLVQQIRTFHATALMEPNTELEQE